MACRAEVVFTSNFWAYVGQYNVAKGKVVDIVYKILDEQDRQIQFYQMQLLYSLNI